MIKSAEQISIGGIGDLKIYGMDFNAATLDSPAELTALLASKTNSFIQGAKPSLSYLKPVNIRIGNLNFSMYAVAHTVVKSASGENYLRVKYIDGSFLLDKYFVALKGKHWEYFDPNSTPRDRIKAKGPFKEFNFNANPSQAKYSIPNNFIVVGTYIDPCKNSSKDSAPDPCDPCPKSEYQDQEQAKLVDCIKSRSLNPLDVEYSFDELITQVKSRGLKVEISGVYNVNYKTNYSGSLRSVFQNWCSDFGLAFIFDSQKNTFRVFDPKVGISIPTISNCQILGETEETSIEHNFAKGVVTRYSKSGEERDFHCEGSSSQVVSCRPLSLLDLIGRAKWREGMPLYSVGDQPFDTQTFDLIEFLCMVSSYDPHLREAIAWFDLYGMRSADLASKLVSGVQTSSGVSGLTTRCGGYTGTNLNDDFERKKFTLPALAMTIKTVIAKNNPLYDELYGKLGEANKKAITDAAKAGFTKPYFVIAYQDKTQFQNMVTWEQNVGRNFLGKYFIRKFSSSLSSNPDITPAADASVKFYKQRVDNVEFGGVLPYRGSYIDELAYDKSPLDQEKRARESFLLVNRNTTFLPSVGEGTEVANLIKLAERALPIDFGSITDILGNITIVNPHPSLKNATWSAEDHLYVAFEGRGFSPSVNTSPVKFPGLEFFYSNTNEYATPTKLGLQSQQCVTASIQNVTIYYPPSSTTREQASGGRSYNILYRAGSSVDFKMFVPKVEFVEGDVPKVLELNVPNFDLNIKEFNNSALPDLKFLESTRSCLPDETNIRKAMKEFNKNLSVVQTNDFLKKTYEIDGVPTLSSDSYINIENFAVRISDKGIKTDITLSNLRNKKILKSDAVLGVEFLESYKVPYMGHQQFVKRTNLVSSTNNVANQTFSESAPINQPL
jgi:hypothetical protein